jgi:hypothetical protein
MREHKVSKEEHASGYPCFNTSSESRINDHSPAHATCSQRAKAPCKGRNNNRKQTFHEHSFSDVHEIPHLDRITLIMELYLLIVSVFSPFHSAFTDCSHEYRLRG